MRLTPRGAVRRLLGGHAPAGARVQRRLVTGHGVLLVLLEVGGGAEAAVGVAGGEELVGVGAVLVQPLGLKGVSFCLG